MSFNTGFRLRINDNPGRAVLRMAQQPIPMPKATKIQIGTKIGFIKPPTVPTLKVHPNWFPTKMG